MSKLPIQKIVQDPQWQILRESFVGTWKKTPSKNIITLRVYLGSMNELNRLRRVLNYLTGSGFRSKIISHPDVDVLLEEVRIKIKEFNQKS